VTNEAIMPSTWDAIAPPTDQNTPLAKRSSTEPAGANGSTPAKIQARMPGWSMPGLYGTYRGVALPCRIRIGEVSRSHARILAATQVQI
jgi:hypothetical protein